LSQREEKEKSLTLAQNNTVKKSPGEYTPILRTIITSQGIKILLKVVVT